MSDLSSDSEANDEDVMLGFRHYNPRINFHGMDYEVESSESDNEPFLFYESRNSPSEVELDNSSERSNSPLSVRSDSSASSSFGPSKDGLKSISRPIKHNRWVTPRELFNREIGNYKNSTLWSTKFRQSLVAVQKLKLSKQLKGHKGCVNSLDFNTAGNLMASGSDDCKIALWNWSEGKCMIMYNSSHTRNIFQTKFLTTQGDMLIVSSARDGFIMLTAVNNCDIVYSKTIARHTGSCNKLGIHPDFPYVILSCGDDGVVKHIDVREAPIEENNQNTDILLVKNQYETPIQIYGIDVNPLNSSEFIINGNDEIVRMYDKRRLSGPKKEFCRQLNRFNSNSDGDSDDGVVESILRKSNITSAVYNYCGSEILASYSDDDIYLFDVNDTSGNYLQSYSGHLNTKTVKGVNFYGPRSDFVISGSDCGHIFMWDKKTQAIVQRKHADKKGAVNVLEAHPHIATLATSGLDKTIKIWEPSKEWTQPNKNKIQKSLVMGRAQRYCPERFHFGLNRDMLPDEDDPTIRYITYQWNQLHNL